MIENFLIHSRRLLGQINLARALFCSVPHGIEEWEREKCRLSYLIAWSTSTEHWGERWNEENTLKALEHKFEVIKIEWNKKMEKNQFDGYRGGSMEWNCRRDCIFNDEFCFFFRQRKLKNILKIDQCRKNEWSIPYYRSLNLAQFILFHIYIYSQIKES